MPASQQIPSEDTVESQTVNAGTRRNPGDFHPYLWPEGAIPTLRARVEATELQCSRRVPAGACRVRVILSCCLTIAAGLFIANAGDILIYPYKGPVRGSEWRRLRFQLRSRHIITKLRECVELTHSRTPLKDDSNIDGRQFEVGDSTSRILPRCAAVPS
jgi:hypothetical protein